MKALKFTQIIVTFSLLLSATCPVHAQAKKPRYCINVLSAIPFDYAQYKINGLSGDTATIKMDTKTTTTTITIDTLPKAIKLIPWGYKFDVIDIIGSYTVIKLWSYGKKDSSISYYNYLKQHPAANNNNSKVSWYKIPSQNISMTQTGDTARHVDDTKDYYLAKTSEMNTNSQEFDYKKGAWNVGIMYLPIKVRAFATTRGFFDFTSDFSLGTGFAYTIKHKVASDWTFNVVAYLGISSIKMDSSIAKDTSFKQTQNITAFSPAGGFYWEKKGIQIGFVVGMDLPSRNLQRTWVYRDMPWFSLSAGISIFKLTNNNNNSKTGTNQTDPND